VCTDDETEPVLIDEKRKRRWFLISLTFDTFSIIFFWGYYHFYLSNEMKYLSDLLLHLQLNPLCGWQESSDFLFSNSCC
jgi:hypothetical protein